MDVSALPKDVLLGFCYHDETQQNRRVPTPIFSSNHPLISTTVCAEMKHDCVGPCAAVQCPSTPSITQAPPTGCWCLMGNGG